VVFGEFGSALARPIITSVNLLFFCRRCHIDHKFVEIGAVYFHADAF